MKFLKHIKLDYDFDHLLEGLEDVERSSCVAHQKTEQTDLHPNGFPESYVLDNTAIRQKFFSPEEIDFEELGRQTNMEVISVSIIKQEPGNVIPIHRDMFFKVKQKYPERTDMIVRANIFLGDWATGQYLEFDNEPCTHWEKNEGYIFNSEVLHLSSNAGNQDKYTMQISGFYVD